MIKLTIHKESFVYLNPESIHAVMENEYAIYEDEDPFNAKVVGRRVETTVECGNDSYNVTESPDEVVRLITEAKRRKMQIQSLYVENYRRCDTHEEIWEVIDRLENEDTP